MIWRVAYLWDDVPGKQRSQFERNPCMRILFLKRLFICFATCGVYYSEEGDALQASARRPVLSSHATNATRSLTGLRPHEV
eukprot:4239453-Amphidinium_carterae.1